MTIDMTQFYQVFFEESAELLAEMERLLLALDAGAPQKEDLDAIFRTAHSIKGGGSTFGFSEITETAHVLETLLDRLRNGELSLSSEMTDVFLKAVDVIKMQLAGRQTGSSVDEAAVRDICTRLSTLGGREFNASPAAAVPVARRVAFGEGGERIVDPSPEKLFAILSAIEERPAEPAYGLFAESQAPGAQGQSPEPPAPSHPMRRASDAAGAAPARTGRRASDRADGERSSIRVSVEKVDQLINLVGELVITQAMLAEATSRLDAAVHQGLLNRMGQLERNTRALQESVMSIRMMPISFVFSRFPRVVRDLAAKLNKQVELKTVGEGTELDKGLIEKIADPLNHLVRNSLDHGIEPAEKRVAVGKDPKGTITLRAFHQGGSIVVEVADDGAGLNRAKILAKARERGFAVHEDMADKEVWQLIFEPGFSTADAVTDVSGRGVGMDVVRKNVRGMGGNVEIESRPGEGICISIRLPLTLAILDGMSIAVGKEIFIIPLTYIVESLQPAREDLSSVTGRGRLVHVRGEYLPVVPLREVFKIEAAHTDIHQGIMVIVESEGIKVALHVDELVGQHQVVIKSLETNYRKTRGISGATIMGDGKVALIMDVVALARGSYGPLLRAA
ncbi:MAG: chemotaxis protein CheW [Betaproteobacteria bacterium]|nr:chemotaxis protein CheW [Betaproteobacteria bacterium]